VEVVVIIAVNEADRKIHLKKCELTLFTDNGFTENKLIQCSIVPTITGKVNIIESIAA